MLGRIPDEQYRLLSAEYTQEQAQIKERLPQLEERQEKLRDSITNASRFVERARQYSEITELTPELLRLFIEKIDVGERAEKYSHSAPQELMIYYRDIGLLDTTEEQDLERELADAGPAA